MNKIITIFNRKGGVGKTTITNNISTMLALTGEKVLMLDLDPQGSLSNRCFDSELNNIKKLAEEQKKSIVNVFNKNSKIVDCIYKTENKNLSIIPSTIEHNSTEDIINQRISKARFSINKIKEEMLMLQELKALDYDYILIDCSPSISIVNVMALNISDYLIIPVVPAESSIEGLSEVFELMEEVRTYNPNINILGSIINMKEHTINDKVFLKKIIEKDISILGEIRKGVKVREAERKNQAICILDEESNVCKDFTSVLDNMILKISLCETK